MSFRDFVWRAAQTGGESWQLERTDTAADKGMPGAKALAFTPGYSALLRAAAASRYFRDELAASCKEFKVSSTPAPLSQVASICS